MANMTKWWLLNFHEYLRVGEENNIEERQNLHYISTAHYFILLLSRWIGHDGKNI